MSTATALQTLLDRAEMRALARLSVMELRAPEDQVRFIVRTELRRRGLLDTVEPVTPVEVVGDERR